jgi:membrane peptidoglycan carboxypeptidase
VQADSLDQPFDLNQGAKLDMGSSAKLRTLITYLQIVAELHAKYQALKAPALAMLAVPERDVLSRWAVDYLRGSDDRDLGAMLRAAMGRLYSADTSEAFFTGGGLHRFVNFKKEDNGRVMDLWEATRNSVNLPFIRLMRDIVRHFIYRAPSTAARVLGDLADPRRQSYLAKFADHEGKTFLAGFYKKYRGLKPEDATSALLNHLTAHPRRLAAVYRYLEPQADLAAFTAFMKSRLANPAAFSEADYRQSYLDYGADRYNLADRAYIAQIHPLELWLVAYQRKHPAAGWDELVAASAQARQDGYDWLFKTGSKDAQDIRIQSLLEIEAFQEIHGRWRRLGYPFSSMVPSYASAIGSSADRPAALAELIGVTLNDGVRLGPASINQLEFGADTPYHTVFRRQRPEGERIFPAEVARVVREALVNVVKQGTARRVDGAFTNSLGKLVVGGKTGTGDHRYETYAPDGTVLESRVVSRVATFAFFIGRRFYGVVTAFVPGEAAGDYGFTSALPVQILKALAPTLQPLVAGGESRQREWAEEAAAFEAENPPPVRAAAAPPAAPPTAAAAAVGPVPAPAAPPAAAAGPAVETAVTGDGGNAAAPPAEPAPPAETARVPEPAHAPGPVREPEGKGPPSKEQPGKGHEFF